LYILKAHSRIVVLSSLLLSCFQTEANAELAKSQSALVSRCHTLFLSVEAYDGAHSLTFPSLILFPYLQVELHVEHKNLQDKYINDMNILASLKKTVKKMKDKMAESEETLEYMRAEMDDLDCDFKSLDRRFQENEEDNEIFQENTNERFNGLETDVHNIGNGLEDVENANANLQDEVDEVKEQANTTSNEVYDLQMAQPQAASAEGVEEEEEEEEDDDDEDDDDGDSQTPQGVPASDEIVASLFTYVLDESGGDNSDSSQQESSHSQQDSSDNEQSADLLSSVPWHDVLD
jgi:uncharacterized protein YoxC